ncbi:MAG: hypothetical protein EHM12_01170 [Dehalococcoidia bacterium]|nr:MAG: hypothetical protein EHM12_01170 [Dehalococcoidia bacterium]
MTHQPGNEKGKKPRYLPTMGQDYSSTSDTARDVNSRVGPLIEAYIDSIAPQISGMGPETPFVIADFGTNDGINSSPLMAAIIAHVRSINSALAFRLFYYDISTRDNFDKFWKGSQLAQVHGVEAEFIQRSYYESYPELEGKLNIGYSSTSVHWMNTKNVSAGFFQHPVNIQPNQLTGAERHKFVEKWEKDWEDFLLKRSDEVVKGGALFMVNLADFGNDEWPASAGYNYIRDICNEMCAEKLITPEELKAIFVPDYFATPQEMQSVIAAPGVKRYFRLEHFGPITVPCAYYPLFQDRLGDAKAREELGNKLAHEVQAWSESSIKTGLSSAHKEKIDEIYKRLENKFCRLPKALPFQYCMVELRKI